MKSKISTKQKKSIGKQYKSVSFDTKDIVVDQDRRTISGYAAIFGNKDKSGDILIKGCFSKSIQERGPESSANDKIIFLWMHKMDEPIGKITKLVEDDKGLYFEAEIDKIQLGDRAINQLESGTLNQFSIGYSYVWDKMEYDEEKDAYIVKEVILYETSVVSIGCNGQTYYSGLKSDEITDKHKELQEKIENELSSLSINKKSAILGLFSELQALMSVKPDEDIKRDIKTLSIEEADLQRRKSLFDGVKFIITNN